MRYFEIVQPSARQILAGTGPSQAVAGKRRIVRIENAGEKKWATPNSPGLQTLISWPSRRPHLSPPHSQ
jgi:hypothetical protein